MTSNTDPRAAGFNYGAPLPLSSLDPEARACYDAANEDALRISAHAVRLSNLAFNLTMKTRDVRIACGLGERALALIALVGAHNAFKRELGELPEDPNPNYSFAQLAGIAKTPYQKDATEWFEGYGETAHHSREPWPTIEETDPAIRY